MQPQPPSQSAREHTAEKHGDVSAMRCHHWWQRRVHHSSWRPLKVQTYGPQQRKGDTCLNLAWCAWCAWCVLWCVVRGVRGVLSVCSAAWHAETSPPCVGSKRLRVYVQNARMLNTECVCFGSFPVWRTCSHYGNNNCPGITVQASCHLD